MSLFPDRSLVPISPRELALAGSTLTGEQNSQLTAAVNQYLKYYHLIGYENTKAILPVIRQCVIDGLQLQYQRENILPEDDLSTAFKKGYAERSVLIHTMQEELEGLSGNAKFEGALALPQDVVQASVHELTNQAFLPQLKAGRKLAGIAEVRRPLFRHLVKYCRDKIEEDIPGSKQVELTPGQEAGLVRNLAFGWVAFREPRLLLGTEDFMLNVRSYLTTVAQQDETVWKQLSTIAGQDSKEAIEYLKDLSAQVTDTLLSVPDKPSFGADALTIASAINTAFKALDPHFLIVNPFSMLPSLSEDPKEKGRSIWDDDKTIRVEVNGVFYRIPTVSTLNLAALLVAGQDIKRSEQLKTGATFVQSLLTEVLSVQTGRKIPVLRAEIEHDQVNLETARKIIIQGGILSEEAMAKGDILQLARGQFKLMRDELKFFPAVKTHHERLITLGLDLLQQYQSGEAVEGEEDSKDILRVYYGAGILKENVLYFLREHVAKRIRDLEDMYIYRNFVDAMVSEVNLEHTRSKFSGTVETTILDVLDFRNRLWFNQFQFMEAEPGLSSQGLATAWSAILQQEKRQLEREVYARASHNFTVYNKSEIAQQRAKILSNQSDPLTIRFGYVGGLQIMLDAGIIPDDKSLFRAYSRKWCEEGDRRIAHAIKNWTNKTEATLLLQEKFDEEEKLGFRKSGNPSSLLDQARKPYGPARIILSALARMAPTELWPSYPLSIEDIAHDISSSDPDNPFAWPRLGRRISMENRLIVHTGLRDWLAANGISLAEETYKDLIKPGAMGELITNSHAYHRLFGIGQEVQSWFEDQRDRLMVQVRDYTPGFYRTAPSVIVKRLEDALSWKQKRLKRLEELAVKRLDSRVKQLQHSGLIRRDSFFI